MNIDTNTTTNVTTPTNINNTGNAKTETTAVADGKSFKDELTSGNAKTEDKKNNNQIANSTTDENELVKTDSQTQNLDKLNNKKEALNIKTGEKDLFETISELNQKIESIHELKNMKVGNIKGTVEKNQYLDSTLNKNSDICKTISLDKADTTFFLNIVENQTMTTQNIQNLNHQTNFTGIKTEAVQKAVTVSQSLIDCLNESMKTNKPFRIDFDNDIAVIMKVDKNGVLSANFIPGSSAVENYLRNNIGYLKQSFEEQDLDYKELSYSNHNDRKQKQQDEKEQQKNKES